MKSTFKVGQKIKEAWPIFTNNLAVFFLMFALVFVLQIISFKSNFFVYVILVIVSIFVSYMIIRFLLSIVDKKEFNPFSKASIPTLRQLWNFVKTYILSFLIGAGIMLVFMVPVLIFIGPSMFITNTPPPFLFIIIMMVSFLLEIYISTRLTFAVFLSVDKNQGARKSIKESWNMTKGSFWNIFLKLLVIGLFSIVGIIGLFVGVLITYPIGMILMVMLYKYYKEIKEGHKEEVIKEAEVL